MKWIEGWYWSYALLGVSAAGILPILMPLSAARGGSAAAAGLVMAAFSLGGIAAPVFGGIADRYGIHRALLTGGLLLTAASSALFPLAGGAGVVLALLQGAGIASASTAANLFIVETHPRGEWDSRIGWLQTFYGVGQVGGLLLAGAFSALPPRIGIWAAAGLSAAGAIPAAIFTPALPGRRGPSPDRAVPAGLLPRSRRPVTSAARHAEWPAHSPHRSYHYLDVGALRGLSSISSPGFWIFLSGWFLSFCGSGAFFSLYPIVMGRDYGVAPGISSISFAVAAGVGLLLYVPAGKWIDARGPLRVLETGLGIRLASYLLLALAARVLLHGAVAIGAFFLIVLAWSPLSVAGTALAAGMSARNARAHEGKVGEGEGIGIFNGMTAFAGVAGALVGGAAAAVFGYPAVPVLACMGTTAGLILLPFARREASPPAAAGSTPGGHPVGSAPGPEARDAKGRARGSHSKPRRLK